MREEHEFKYQEMRKINDNLQCKLQILEGQMHEESKMSINKISNLKLKNLSLAKTIEDKDSQIEAGKKREKDLKIKASSQRRIQSLMQEKIDRLNKQILELQTENHKMTNSNSKV